MALIATESINRCNNCGGAGFDEIARSPDFEYATCENEFVFGRCRTCGLVHLLNRPSIDTLSTIYPASYIPHRFNEHLGPFITRLRNIVQGGKVRAIARYAAPDATIVDVGPGNGELLRILRDLGDKSWKLVGVDFADDAVQAVTEIGARGIKSRFEDLRWPDAAPPRIVIMNQVIEHLADPAAAIAKAFDILPPGGALVIETPSTAAWDARMFRGRHWGGWHTPRHWVLYDEATLRSALERSGFEVVETSYLLSPNFWLQSVHHYLSDRARLPRLAKLFDVKNFPMLAIASALDLVQRTITGKTSNFRMVGRKPRANDPRQEA